MKLLRKQIYTELFKNRIYLLLLLMLTIFTSFMYSFVHFSIDGNLQKLKALSLLSENQLAFQRGLQSNAILAGNILLVFVVLTVFIFGMFFGRFYKANSRQIGCLKSLGFKDKELRKCFVQFTAILSAIGLLLGLLFGYFASAILIQASMRSYQVTDLVRKMHIHSILVGLLVPEMIFCMGTYLSYYLILGKEIAVLIAGGRERSAFNSVLRFAEWIARLFPAKNRLAVRLAFRKPVSITLVIISVITFSILFLMAYSLNLSSAKVFESQTEGHYYKYDTHFDEAKTGFAVRAEAEAIPYLDVQGTVLFGEKAIAQTLVGMERCDELFVLSEKEGKPLESPLENEVIIGTALKEMYGIEVGDSIIIKVQAKQYKMKVSGIAYNAKMNHSYLSKNRLAEIMTLSSDSYTGILSMDAGEEAGEITTREQRLEELERGAVSNRSSALINQVIGCLMGGILLLLALLLNFQDSTRDILILHLMGYKAKEISKMLLDIYKPILCMSFVLSLYPAMLIVKLILRNISLQIDDYMPFQTNLLIIAGIFFMQNIVYAVIQAAFGKGIQKIVKKEIIADYTSQ